MPESPPLVVPVDFQRKAAKQSQHELPPPNAPVLIGAFKTECGTTCGALKYFTGRSAAVALI